MRKQSTAKLAADLPNRLGKVVVDETGLNGLYDFDLEYRDDGPKMLTDGLKQKYGLVLTPPAQGEDVSGGNKRLTVVLASRVGSACSHRDAASCRLAKELKLKVNQPCNGNTFRRVGTRGGDHAPRVASRANVLAARRVAAPLVSGHRISAGDARRMPGASNLSGTDLSTTVPCLLLKWSAYSRYGVTRGTPSGNRSRSGFPQRPSRSPSPAPHVRPSHARLL